MSRQWRVGEDQNDYLSRIDRMNKLEFEKEFFGVIGNAAVKLDSDIKINLGEPTEHFIPELKFDR